MKKKTEGTQIISIRNKKGVIIKDPIGPDVFTGKFY